MRVLVTGANGQLGYDVIDRLQSLGIESFGLKREKLDLTNFSQLNEFIRNFRPYAVIHCAAYTDVDKAENDKVNCIVQNVSVTENLANICKLVGAKLLYVSTDYVFSGEGHKPYEIDSVVAPLSVYGQSKLDGEKIVFQTVENHYIVRTSWAFGIHGDNFVNAMLEHGKDKDEINVVADQVGSPTYTKDLARVIVDIVKTDKYGTYHATNEGFCSRAEFAVEIFRQVGYSTTVNFITSDQYPTLAKRPLNSRLSKNSLELAGFNLLPKWEDALSRYLEQISVFKKNIRDRLL